MNSDQLNPVIVLFLYAYALPLFRTSQILGGVAVLVPMCVYTPLLWVEDRNTQIILASLGILVDLARVDLIAYNIMGRFSRWTENRDGEARGLLSMPKLKEGIRVPGGCMLNTADTAMNIEHAIERSSAFVVIVLGELV